jgi:hypothetical protein
VSQHGAGEVFGSVPTLAFAIPKEALVPLGEALARVVLDNPVTTLALVCGTGLSCYALKLGFQYRTATKKMEAEAKSKTETFAFTKETLNSVLDTVSKQTGSSNRRTGRNRKKPKE